MKPPSGQALFGKILALFPLVFFSMRAYNQSMKKTFTKDIVKTTLKMAWPSVVESFFVALAGVIDSLMVSGLGSDAVAAVGLTTQPKFIGLAFFIATNIGISALVARRLGEQRKNDANSILMTAIKLIIVASVIISALMVIFADPIIRFCGSTEETHDDAVIYFQVIMGGMIFNTLSLGINAAQRGIGNTKITMRANLVSSGVNIVFNYLLIEGHLGFPRLEMFGAALATVLGTVVACVMSILSVMKKDCYINIPYAVSEKLRGDSRSLRSMLSVSSSVFVEQLFLRVGFFATAWMAARMGNDGMAAHQVGMNVMSLSFSFGDGLQAAAVALIGRSLGEEKPDLAKKYATCCELFGLAISLVLIAIYVSFGRNIYQAFFPNDPSIVDIGVFIMYIIAATCFFQIRAVIIAGALRGAGDTRYTAFCGIITVTFIRTIVSYVCGFVLNWGILGVWCGVFADMFFRLILMGIRLRSGKWTKIKI